MCQMLTLYYYKNKNIKKMARLFLFFGKLGKFDHPFVMAIGAPVGRDKVPLDYLEPKNSHETPDLDQEDYPQYPADTDPHVVFPDCESNPLD